jgi:hypothetical protein
LGGDDIIALVKAAAKEDSAALAGKVSQLIV